MLRFPAPGFAIGDRYGERPSTNANGYKTSTMHGGLDLVPTKGGSRTVVAAADGVLVRSPYNAAAGNAVCIAHADVPGVEATGYAHLASRLLPVGASVVAGQPIGVAGSTGASTGVHLHFDVFADLDRFIRVDPLPLLNRKTTAPASPQTPTPIRRQPSMFLIQLANGTDQGKIFLVTANGWVHVPDMTVLGLFVSLIQDAGGTGKVTVLADYAAQRVVETLKAAA